MRIRFLRNFRGKLTAERFYLAGDTAEIEDTAGRHLVAQGVAERLDEPQIAHSAKPDAPALPRRSARKDAV